MPVSEKGMHVLVQSDKPTYVYGTVSIQICIGLCLPNLTRLQSLDKMMC